MLISALLAKMAFVRVFRNYVKICKTYTQTPDKAGVLHAATCLQIGAILITDDRHFDNIKKEGIISAERGGLSGNRSDSRLALDSKNNVAASFLAPEIKIIIDNFGIFFVIISNFLIIFSNFWHNKKAYLGAKP